MKNLAVLFVLSSLLFSCGGSDEVEVGQKTTMTVEKVFDAGDVAKGEVITAKFNIENTGEYPLVIAEVKGSCSCTVADYPEDPIMPGDKGVILAHVNTDKTGTGLINKTVRIVSNTTPSITQVVIKANVSNK
jgi:hypothetical protein